MFTPDDPFYYFWKMLKSYGLEYISGRYYSKYPGKVVLNSDPQQQGRVTVSVGALAKNGGAAAPNSDETLELHAYPSSPFSGKNYGFYFPPEKNDNIWVWFENGNPNQPQVSGGWWGNSFPDASQLTADKPPQTSEIPVEFNSVRNAKLENNNSLVQGVLAPNTTTLDPDGDPKLPLPDMTTRGIKSKRGHGILFEDDPVVSAPGAATAITTFGRETRLELWTGEPGPTPSSTPGQAPQPLPAAIKRHRFVMSDALSNITITSNGKHSQIFDDRSTSQGIRITSTYGHQINIDDLLKSATFKTKLGHSYSASDITNTITISTVGKQSLVFNDILLTTTLTATGTSLVNTIGSATYQSGAAMQLTAGGALILTANGITIQSKSGAPSVTISGGVVNNIFTGLATEQYNGGLTQKVNGIYQLTADQLSLISTIISLGSLASKFHLIDERFIAFFNAHTHGGPGTPPTILILPPTNPLAPIPDPALAPNLDIRLFSTQNVLAS